MIFNFKHVIMIQFSYTNKVAIITGSAVGIGFEIAKQLVKAGASVVTNDVDGKALENAINDSNLKFIFL